MRRLRADPPLRGLAAVRRFIMQNITLLRRQSRRMEWRAEEGLGPYGSNESAVLWERGRILRPPLDFAQGPL